MEGPAVNQPIDQAISVPVQEQAPVQSRTSKILRPLSKALGTAAFAAAALGPGKAEAMDQNTKNTLYGLGAAVLNQQTGVVIRPGFNGNPTLDVGATMHNRQIMEQQRVQREQAEAMQRRNMEIQAAFNKPTNFNIQPALPELERMGVIAVDTGSRLYLYHKDTVNTPDFLKKQFYISSNNVIKITDLSLLPVPGGLIVKSNYIGAQGQRGSEERMLVLDPNTKTFSMR